MNSASLDALPPQDTARRAEETGLAKARRDAFTLLLLSILAGAFIALGAMFANLVGVGMNGSVPFGLGRLVIGLVFSLGLVMVVVCGAELFTGDVLMTIAWASRRLGAADLGRAWGLIFLGNFAGAAGTALIVFVSGHLEMADGRIGAAALRLAIAKTSLPLWNGFWLGVLCNVLVCLAVWGSLAARSVTDKILIVMFPVAAFVAAGFEHSIANMYTVSLGLLIKHFGDGASLAAFPPDALGALNPFRFATTLAAVTAGNLIGGAVLVALIYWLAFLRPSARR